MVKYKSYKKSKISTKHVFTYSIIARRNEIFYPYMVPMVTDHQFSEILKGYSSDQSHFSETTVKLPMNVSEDFRQKCSTSDIFLEKIWILPASGFFKKKLLERRWNLKEQCWEFFCWSKLELCGQAIWQDRFIEWSIAWSKTIYVWASCWSSQVKPESSSCNQFCLMQEQVIR